MSRSPSFQGGPLDANVFFGLVPADDGALAFISPSLPASDRRDWAWWTPSAPPIAFASTLHPSVEALGGIAIDPDPDPDPDEAIVGPVASRASKTFEYDEIRRDTAPDTFEVIAVSQTHDPTSPAIRLANTIVGGPRLLVVGVNEDSTRTVYEAGTDGPGGLTAVVGPVVSLLGQDDAGRIFYVTLDDSSGIEFMVLDGDQTTRIMGHGDTVETSRGPGTLRFDSVVRPTVAPDGRVGAVGCVELPKQPLFCDYLVFVASRPIVGQSPDVNGDGTVDFLDVLSILSLWGTDDVAADLDGNGIVDFGDLLTLLEALA
ncbi:MAG: hypothetical protein AB8G96_08730 [Phycisphaerales bacterium]